MSTSTAADEQSSALVRQNLRLVALIGRQFANRGVDASDLIQEGSIGLIKASRRFDETDVLVGDQRRQQRSGEAAAGDHEPPARRAAFPERARSSGHADVHGLVAGDSKAAAGENGPIPLP